MTITRKIRPACSALLQSVFAALTLAVLIPPAARPQSAAAAASSLAAASLSSKAAPVSPREPPIFPLSEIRKGQTGVAYTVFEGTRPEAMDVEILGVLKDSIGPGQDMILARLHGVKPEFTGVVAGMSGSPVYIGGRLVGALSYRIGQFSKEPIAGITPIEQMLEVRDLPENPPAANHAAPPEIPGPGAELKPIETPLFFSGIGQETLDLFGDRFRAAGLDPVAGLGGAANPEQKQPEPIVPGSAVSAVLLRGDMSAAATCTVTYVDPHRLLACGHPFTQYGAVDIPMTKATVLATLPSPLNAFKIVNTTETVGAFTEDRSSAILGVFGRQARMIPVTVQVDGGDVARGEAASHTFHYEVLDNPGLTPSTMLVSVYQSLHGTNRAGEETSYRVTGNLSLRGFRDVRLDRLVVPADSQAAAINVALYINESFSRVYDNPVDKPILTGLHLHVSALADRRSAVLEDAALSRSEARAGDTIEVQATLRPYHGADRLVRIPLHLPETLAPGPLRIVVADASTLDRLTEPASSSAHAAGLAETVASLNRLHPNDRIFCAVLDPAPQAVLESGPLPELPLSMANVLEPLKETHRVQLTGESVIATTSVKLDDALTGSQVLTLVIR